MTVKELAELCEVSPSTVSRVLNNDEGVSEAVRRKVVETGRKHGYFGKLPEKEKKGNIGLVVKNTNSLFFENVLCFLHKEIYARGYLPYTKKVPEDGDEVEAARELNRLKKTRGVIFLSGRGDYAPEELTGISIPYLFCSFSNRFGTLPADSFSSVTGDDYMTGYAAAETLLSAGHRRIAALINDKNDRGVCELRYSGFCAALADHGIKPESILLAETNAISLDAAYDKTLELLENAGDLTAIFAASDEMAICALKAIYDKGLHVPGDISVIGIDGLLQSRFTIPTLTTVVQSAEDLARKSVQVLTDIIEKGEPNRHIILPTKLRLGKSIRYIENAPL